MGRFKGDLPERTYRFAKDITDLIDQLPSGTKGWVIGRQLLKSGTSVGANTEEADCALTDREFMQFCNVARRESAESRFWLRLCMDCGLLSMDVVTKPCNEMDELVKIFTTVIRNTRSRAAAT
jgi:four helix bundle protein